MNKHSFQNILKTCFTKKVVITFLPVCNYYYITIRAVHVLFVIYHPWYILVNHGISSLYVSINSILTKLMCHCYSGAYQLITSQPRKQVLKTLLCLSSGRLISTSESLRHVHWKLLSKEGTADKTKKKRRRGMER